MKRATANWRRLHQGNRYFDQHPLYQGPAHLSDIGMEQVRQYLDVGKHSVILDLGCGYGRLMWHLLDVAGEVWGYDVAEEPLDRAALLLQSKALNWRLFLGNGQTLGWPLFNESLDAVISLCVFQHIPKATAKSLINDMGRVLKPGGRAAIQFLCGPKPNDVDLAKVEEPSVQYAEAEIRKLVTGSGLELETLERQNIGHKSLSYLWLVVRKG